MPNRLMPISDPAKFIGENGEIMTPRYIVGEPRDYRLNLGNGVLTLGGGKQVTEPNQQSKKTALCLMCKRSSAYIR